MKKRITILLIGAILMSCGESNTKEQNIDTSSENKTTVAIKKEVKNSNNITLLCTINGEKWEYISDNGIVSQNSTTKVRTATIGFKRKLEKGSESIQLEYDVDKNILNNVWVQLKQLDKDGNPNTAFYTQYGDKINLAPEASLSGTLSLNEDTRKASGTAEITISIDNSQDDLANPDDALITISGLSFTDVSYSDTDDLKKLMKK